MSRRAEIVAALLCISMWLLAVARMRAAYSLDFRMTIPSAPQVPPRPTVLFDVARLGREGAFRPSLQRPPVIDTATLAQPVARELPLLSLKGIVGGPPWFAVLSQQGRSGEDRVLGAGDSLGPVEVRAVRPGVVTLHMGDTTWTIALLQERLP